MAFVGTVAVVLTNLWGLVSMPKLLILVMMTHNSNNTNSHNITNV